MRGKEKGPNREKEPKFSYHTSGGAVFQRGRRKCAGLSGLGETPIPSTLIQMKHRDALLGLLAAGLSLGGGEVPASDLPEPISQENFGALLEDSPFLRTLNPAETYRLRGLATIGGQPVATVFNQKTEKTAVITTEKARNEWGLRLVEVSRSDNLSSVSVVLALSGEEFELAYDPERVAPAPQRGGAKGSKVQYDSKGRAQPPKELIQKYYSMSDQQRRKYWEWRNRYYQKNPKLKVSPDRFPIVDKAIDAIKSGKEPPK